VRSSEFSSPRLRAESAVYNSNRVERLPIRVNYGFVTMRDSPFTFALHSVVGDLAKRR
jgi:hypothetical protein